MRFYLVVRWLCKCHPGKLPAKSRYEGYCGRRNVSVHMSSTHVAGLPGWLRGWLAAHFGPLRQRCRPAVPEVDPKWTRNDTLRPTSEPALLRPTSTHFGDIPRRKMNTRQPSPTPLLTQRSQTCDSSSMSASMQFAQNRPPQAKHCNSSYSPSHSSLLRSPSSSLFSWRRPSRAAFRASPRAAF